MSYLLLAGFRSISFLFSSVLNVFVVSFLASARF
jgi:hypothetical protein